MVWFHRETQSTQTRLIRTQVVSALWEKHVINSELSTQEILEKLGLLQDFLSSSLPPGHSGNAAEYTKTVKQKFVLAIKNKNYSHFANLFRSLSINELRMINNGEGLSIKIPQHQLSTITSKSIHLLQKYLADTGYSATVSIRSNNTTYTIASESIDPKAPFAMHSVGKVFTGVLMLIAIKRGLISEDDLDKPIQLDSSVKEQLSLEVQKRLEQVTLQQIMLHESGLGDYLNKYCDAIREATLNSTSIPEIRNCHDILKFADTDVGSPRYSNLGILLVGLAIEHACHLKIGKAKSYEEILHDFIIHPVGMSVFSIHRPSNGCYNSADLVAQHIVASPAGGYWTTVDDLQKFGHWVNLMCQSDPEFLRLLETYGGEFYSHETREIVHSGGIDSASAFLISSLESGTTIAILSDQGGVAPKLSMTIAEQSVLDNDTHTIRSLMSTNLGFFRKLEDEYLTEHRHDDPRLQHEYDKRFGLVLKK